MPILRRIKYKGITIKVKKNIRGRIFYHVKIDKAFYNLKTLDRAKTVIDNKTRTVNYDL
jgi:hypothetical protein